MVAPEASPAIRPNSSNNRSRRLVSQALSEDAGTSGQTSRAGTPSYLAPERFKQAPVNEHTEIYAIGVTLYEVLTQKFPFGEIEPFQNPSFDKNIKAPSKLNPKIPAWLESIILRALDTDTDQRYRNYSEMQYEVSNPLKVKPYFDKSKSIMERNPLLVCRIGFVGMLVLNMVQLFWL